MDGSECEAQIIYSETRWSLVWSARSCL